MHCCLATGGPGAAMRHAPFGRPRHPLGTFPCGKVPRPPAGGRNLPQETVPLWQAGNELTFKGFRLCGGDQGAFRSPPGPLRGPSLYAWAKPPTRNKLLAEGRKKALPFFFPYRKGFRLCGGDQRAFRSPFGNLRPFAAHGGFHKKQIPCGRQEKSLPCFTLFRGRFRLCGGDQGAFRSPPGPLRGSVR